MLTKFKITWNNGDMLTANIAVVVIAGKIIAVLSS
jgi:hypothetical protein